MSILVLPTDAPVIIGPPQGRWTYADWEALPDDGNRYEVIDGVLYRSTAPSYFHQYITLQLCPPSRCLWETFSRALKIRRSSDAATIGQH